MHGFSTLGASNIWGDAGAGKGAKVPRSRGRIAPIPPPTSVQVDAFAAMQDESKAYERGARDYKDAVTTIISHHYEEKKKAILSSLDREVDVEQAELRKARDIAILRLEEFVAKYSGANAQPEATPDAMYRLAALYEERARSQEDASDPEAGAKLTAALKPSIHLYKRIVHEFPSYKEIAGVFYFLGHLLSDCGRMEESQQVWRSLVCHDHYSYPVPTNPKDSDVDQVLPMPGDHDVAFWKVWRNRYPSVEALRKGPKDDITFVNPFPQDCAAIAQSNVAVGQEPKYVAEVWWRIGDWEFDQRDIGGGVIDYEPSAVWDYNRAASAYTHSLGFTKPPLFGVALYKFAWTLFKQQRYEAAVSAFVRLLRYTDEQEKLTAPRTRPAPRRSAPGCAMACSGATWASSTCRPASRRCGSPAALRRGSPPSPRRDGAVHPSHHHRRASAGASLCDHRSALSSDVTSQSA